VTHDPQHYTLYARFRKRDFGAALLGLLRALADDYNSLVSIEHSRNPLRHVDEDIFTITVLQENWPARAGPELVRH